MSHNKDALFYFAALIRFLMADLCSSVILRFFLFLEEIMDLDFYLRRII
jgi:hypothetical protein